MEQGADRKGLISRRADLACSIYASNTAIIASRRNSSVSIIQNRFLTRVSSLRGDHNFTFEACRQ